MKVKVKELRTKKGSVKIEINGFIYHSNKRSKNRVYWLCEFTKSHNCKARATTMEVDGKHCFVSTSSHHIHPAVKYMSDDLDETDQQERILRLDALTINFEQKKRFIDLLKLNPDVAKGIIKSDDIFKEFAADLNALGPPRKEYDVWQEVLKNWKERIMNYIYHSSQGDVNIALTNLDRELMKLLECDTQKNSLTIWNSKLGNDVQISQLVELLQQNPEVAKGKCSKSIKKQKFMEFSTELNALGSPNRNYNDWYKAWIKWKKQCLAKSVCPPGQLCDPEIHLTELEETVVRLLYSNSDPYTYQFEPNEILSDEDSDLASDESDNEADDVDILEMDEDIVYVSEESLEAPEFSSNEDRAAIWHEPRGKDLHEEKPVICEQTFPLEVKQELIETFPSNDIKEEETKIKRCYSEESLDGHVEEFLNMKNQLQSLKEGHENILRDQIFVEDEFHNKVLNFMGDIKTSMANIESYLKMSLEKNDALIELKKATLEAYQQSVRQKKSEKQAKLDLKYQLLECKRRKLEDLRSKTES